MTELEQFAQHARRMSTAEHKPECKGYAIGPPNWVDHDWGRPKCPGCVTDSDRELWARLATEAEAWLARNVEEALPI